MLSSTSAIRYYVLAKERYGRGHLSPTSRRSAVTFKLYQDIADYLTLEQFFIDSKGNTIRYNGVKGIDPTLVVGPGWVFREKGLLRDQVWDKDS